MSEPQEDPIAEFWRAIANWKAWPLARSDQAFLGAMLAVGLVVGVSSGLGIWTVPYAVILAALAFSLRLMLILVGRSRA